MTVLVLAAALMGQTCPNGQCPNLGVLPISRGPVSADEQGRAFMALPEVDRPYTGPKLPNAGLSRSRGDFPAAKTCGPYPYTPGPAVAPAVPVAAPKYGPVAKVKTKTTYYAPFRKVFGGLCGK